MQNDTLKGLSINFELEILKIDLTKLSSYEVHELNLKDYQIGYFNLSSIIQKFDPKNEVFKKPKQIVLDSKMDQLISFIENERTNLIPPILELSGEFLIIRDGKHRIGLCWHIDIEEIPFLFLTSNFTKLIELLK